MMSSAKNTIISTESRAKHLFGPGWDFLLLGGGSLLALLGLRLILDSSGFTLSVTATLMLANVINHPHFAHSYQIFYRDFFKKLTCYPADLRWRYLFSGIIVPIALISFFAATIFFQTPQLLGLAANLMFFLVGWHYVKQGYGMAMVDAVLKQAFYSDQEKRCFLHNAYATWIFSWLLINHMGDASKSKYWDIAYFVLPVSVPMLVVAGLVCAYTSITLYMALRCRILETKAVAWNGVVAYLVSLYAWLLIRDPLVLLWVPLFHSLQYLTVVWRYEINRTRSISAHVRPALRLAFFAAIGFGLGYFGFWALPQWLDANVEYSKDVFGGWLFFYLFWIFINIHHYSLDTVMWRKGNPDVQAHLFSHKS